MYPGAPEAMFFEKSVLVSQSYAWIPRVEKAYSQRVPVHLEIILRAQSFLCSHFEARAHTLKPEPYLDLADMPEESMKAGRISMDCS